MSAARRGEIWLTDFGDPIGREQASRRPALVISDDRLNAGASGVVVVIPLTTRHRGLPLHAEIDAAQSGLDAAQSGLDATSYVRCEDIRSVSEERLIARLGLAPVEVMLRVEQVTCWLLGIEG